MPGANHGANVRQLADAERLEATNTIRSWAGLAPLAPVAPALTPSAPTRGATLSLPSSKMLHSNDTMRAAIEALFGTAPVGEGRLEPRRLF